MPQLYVLHALAVIVGVGTLAMLLALAIAKIVDRVRERRFIVRPLGGDGDDGANITAHLRKHGKAILVKGETYWFSTPIDVGDGIVYMKGARLNGRFR